MRNIKYIAIHCSAGYSLLPAIENFWYKNLGWKSPGYHIVIYPDGTRWYVTSNGSYSTDYSKLDLNKITNGVQGFNSETVHISYIGGVEKTNTSKSLDSRTPEQKKSIIEAIKLVQNVLKSNGQDISKIKIQGHRDFSPDKNGNGVIDSWERIKECPSFDAIPEYKDLIPNSTSNVVYTLADLNLREGAGLNFKVLSVLKKGTTLNLISTAGDWSNVSLYGTTGWVSSKYIR